MIEDDYSDPLYSDMPVSDSEEELHIAKRRKPGCLTAIIGAGLMALAVYQYSNPEKEERPAHGDLRNAYAVGK